MRNKQSINLFHEILYGETAAVKWFKQKHRNDEIIFVSPATISLIKTNSRFGVARRGIAIFTQKQIFFKSVPFSLYTLLYLMVAMVGFIYYWITQYLPFLIAGFIAGGMISQRLPLQKQFSTTDCHDYILKTHRSFTGIRFRNISVLTFTYSENTNMLYMYRMLPEEVLGIMRLSSDAAS